MVDKQEIKKLIKDVDNILFEDWDPIDVNSNQNLRDEYSSYAATFAGMIERDEPTEKLVSALMRIETIDMGLEQRPERRTDLEAVVAKLKSLKK